MFIHVGTLFIYIFKCTEVIKDSVFCYFTLELLKYVNDLKKVVRIIDLANITDIYIHFVYPPNEI